MSILKPTILLALASASALTIFLAAEALSKYEEPKFEILEIIDLGKGKKIEIREYKPRITAEVTVEGAWHEALNTGFKILAGYIFGQNTSDKKVTMTTPVATSAVKPDSMKIAMTTPVTAERSHYRDSESSQDKAWKIRFYMPSEFTLETLPGPKDKRIELKELPSETFAVIKFSGFSKFGSFEREREEIERSLNLNTKYEVKGEPLNAFYNPPWTPPFMRRNEVLIPIIKRV